MAAGKTFEFLFQLSAKLGPNFSQSFKNAQKTMGVLQSDLASANKKLKDVSAYQKQQEAVAKSRDKVNDLQEKHEALKRQIEETGEATPELTRKLKDNEKQLKNAREAVEKQEEKLQRLSETLREAGVDTDNLGRDTEELRREYERLEQSQKKIQEITEKQNKNSEAISKTKGQIAGTIGTVTALAGSFFALDAATEEYRNNQAKLTTAFQAAGLSTDAAKEAYAGFYKILGDDDTATEASQLLAKLARSEEDVAKWTDIAAGIYGTFGDSLPIEGLIESANETARTGTITGSFADAINWASKEGETFGVTLKENTKANEEWNKAVEACESAEDYFNLALQSCGSEAERNQLIMDTLQGTYQDATTAFKENNKQIIQNRQAQVVWNDILGKTGQIAGTVKGMIIEMLGVSEDGSVKANSALSVLQTTLGKIADNPELIKTIAKTVALLAGLKAGGLTAKLGFLHVKGGILSVQKAFAIMSGIGIDKYMENAGKGTKILVKAFEKIRGSGIVKTITQVGGGFGGILTKIAPVVGIIAAIGGAIYYVSTHLEQVRGFIQKTFGDEGLAVFEKLWGMITQVGTALKDAFFTSGSGVLDSLKSVLPTIITTLQTGLLPLLPMIADLIMQIVPLIGQLITAILPVLGQLISAILPILATLIAEILPVIVQLISALLPVIMQIVQSILPAFVQLINTIVPILTQIVQAILPVIIQLIQTLLPVIQQIIDTVLPVFISLLNTIVPIFQNIIQAILPVLQQLLQALIPVIQLLAEIFANVLGTALQTVANIVSSVMQIFQGLIDFITGVFTGNWSQAWEGIKSIFSGIFSGLGEIFKAPFKVIVSVINTVIRGLNKLKVPDWVPGIGGKGINIPEIPGFAKGTNRTPSTFIAGENGPELITNAANRKVFTAAQTGQIFNNMAKAGNVDTANNVNAGMGTAGTITIHVTNSPSVTVTGGGDTSGIKAQLQQYDEEFLEKLRTIIITILEEQKEQKGRVAYA